MQDITKITSYNLACLPFLNLPIPLNLSPPADEECMALWKKYDMPDHICRHSQLVADIATAMAEKAVQRGHNVSLPYIRASALLHDIAKAYTIKYGGSHAQLGASWVITETHNYAIAQGVMHHVHWPWQIDEHNVCTLPFFVIYADKRVRHDSMVSLKDRFDDLLLRYGHTEVSRKGIEISYRQGQDVERLLSAKLGVNLDECIINSGRLVERA